MMTERALKGMQMAFVGSGTMAEAMIRAVLRTEVGIADHLVASGPRSERAQDLQDRYGIAATTDNKVAVAGADIVVLSVKPQVLPSVMGELKGLISPEALVFSIVAGMPISVMRSGLGHRAIVRSMPNTPAQLGEGMTVWTASADVSEDQKSQARTILLSMGSEMYVTNEGSLDMATAVSGTGPTYVFLLMEALVDAAVHLGFSRRQARELVIQTVLGSAVYAKESELHLAELRNQVTSPGGTSAEAIYQLEKGGLRTVLSKAIWAAYNKSRLLGESMRRPVEGPLKIDANGN